MPRPRQPGSVFTKITLACGPNAPEPDYARTAPLSPTAAAVGRRPATIAEVSEHVRRVVDRRACQHRGRSSP